MGLAGRRVACVFIERRRAQNLSDTVLETVRFTDFRPAERKTAQIVLGQRQLGHRLMRLAGPVRQRFRGGRLGAFLPAGGFSLTSITGYGGRIRTAPSVTAQPSRDSRSAECSG